MVKTGKWLPVLAGAAVAVGLWLLNRPAQLRGVSVTAVTPGTPPLAHIALSYGPGRPPYSLIVDLLGPDGSVGSATIDGQQLFAEIPLTNPPEATYQVVATAYHHTPFGLRVLTWPV